MNAKRRYRQRLKLQAALTRVLEVLADNETDGISAGRTSAELAAQLVVWLVKFTVKAGVEIPNLADGPDLSRFAYLKEARLKQTKARRRRTQRKGSGSLLWSLG